MLKDTPAELRVAQQIFMLVRKLASLAQEQDDLRETKLFFKSLGKDGAAQLEDLYREQS